MINQYDVITALECGGPLNGKAEQEWLRDLTAQMIESMVDYDPEQVRLLLLLMLEEKAFSADMVDRIDHYVLDEGRYL